DGIRDFHVTGVQTCALPICRRGEAHRMSPAYSVTRLIGFCYGHRLLNYSGKCRYLHGHNGLLEVTVKKKGLDRLGMVMDFSEIRSEERRVGKEGRTRGLV